MINKFKFTFAKPLKLERANYMKRVSIGIIMLSIYTVSLQAANIQIEGSYDFKPFSEDTENANLNLWLQKKKSTLQNFLNDGVVGEARNLARKGAIQLDNGERIAGLENLYKAWSMNKKIHQVAIMIAISHLGAKEYNQLLYISLKLKTLHPELSDGYLLSGLAYANKNQNNQAINAFEELLKIKPGEPGASYNLANFAMARGEHAFARTYLENALKLNPLHIKLVQGLLKLEKIEGNYHASENLITKTIQAYPDSSLPIVLMTQVYKDQREYKKIIHLVESVWHKFSKNEKLLEVLSWAYMNTNDSLKAHALINDYLRKSPESINGHLFMALIYEREEQYKKSLVSIEKALKVDAENLSVKYLQARVFFRKRQFDQSKSILEKISISHPQDIQVLELQANIALLEKNPAKAIELLEKVLKQGGSNLHVVQLSVAHVGNNETKKAFVVLNDWLKLHPSDFFTLNALADLAIENDQWDMAAKQYKTILKIKPEDSLAQNHFAYASLKKGNKKLALQYIEKAYKSDPKNPDILDTMASIQLAMGEHEKALSLFKQATVLKPDNMSIKLNFAKALIQSGQVEQGKNILNKILEIDVAYAKAQDIKALLRGLE